jgi:hypothetical protein
VTPQLAFQVSWLSTVGEEEPLLVERIAFGDEPPSIVKLAMNRPKARNSFNKALLAKVRLGG